MEQDRRTRCGGCSASLDEPANLLPEKRQPCRDCGSRSRVFEIELGGEINPRGSLRLKARHRGGSRPFVDLFVGSDLFRKVGPWMHKVRRIDREADSYQETVTDPETGKIVHETLEPLSEHRGR